jgi:capsular exopolysaccharide synthesis family protein
MSEEKEPKADIDLRAYVRVLWAFKWLILATTATIGTVVILWTLRQPRSYEAIAVIEYDPAPARPLGQDLQDVADPIGGYWMAREFFATQNRIIASRAVATRVVQRLGLHEDPAYLGRNPADFEPVEPEALAGSLLARLKVEQIKDTRLVHLIVRDASPERAKAIADAFADIYIEKTMEDRMASTVSALEWLGSQLDQLRQDLDASELALHAFKEEHNVLSVSMEDRQNLVAGEIQALSGALTNARQKRIEMSARVARLRSALQDDDPVAQSGVVFDDRSALQGLRENMRAKLAERERLGTRYGAAHPQIRGLNEEIEALRTQLVQEIDTIVRSAEADLREVRSVEAGVASALEQAHEAGLALNLREIEYNRLSREQENKQKLYQLVLQRTTEADLTRMLRTTYVRLVDRAEVPRFPVAPNRTLNAVVGVAGGLLLGVLLAFVLRFLDRRIRSVEGMEALGVTVLGVLPSIVDSGADAAAAKARRGRVPNQSRELVVHDSPMSTAAECCRTIRTNLAFMSVGDAEGLRVFVVTSSNPREGKTTVVSNLAASIAQSGKRVLAIDTDLRKPRLHQVLGINRLRGVTTFVVGEGTFEEVVQGTRVPNLDAITSGPVPPNPAELLHSPAFARLIAEARRRYDIVVFDSPPLGPVTDAAIVVPQVDGVLIVAKAGETTRDALNSTLRQLRDVGGRVLGAVLNGLDLRSDGYYGKGYYYRKYGGYYGTEENTSEAAE